MTDVDVVLGYINPDYFWGGKLELEERLAERAVRRHLAEPMDTSVEEAAIAARSVVDNEASNSIFNEIALQGYDPRNFSILSYGGAGPTHACSYAEDIGISQIIIPPFGPVLSAAGAGNLDQKHVYEQSVYMNLFDGEGNQYFEDYERFNTIVEDLKAEGSRDLIDEGFDEGNIEHTVEAEMHYGAQLQTTTAQVPVEQLREKQDLLALIQSFRASYGGNFGEEAHMPESGINLRTIRVQSYIPETPMEYTSKATSERSVVQDGTGQLPVNSRRNCCFDGEFVETPVYRHADFDAGAVDGPAIIEHPETTIVVNDGWRYERRPSNVSYLRKNLSQRPE